MSAEIINLRQARKRRDQAAKSTKADENRVQFGRSKREREQAEKSSEKEARRLDGHWLDAPVEDGDGSDKP